LIWRSVLAGESSHPTIHSDPFLISTIFSSRVTGQPSSKTSYVVLGSDAGPSKLAAIKKHGLKTLSEDAFLELIATRVVGEGGYDEKTKKKMEKEEEAIRAGARELEKRERKMEKEKAGDGAR
jgi:replication factor C subunit 1